MARAPDLHPEHTPARRTPPPPPRRRRLHLEPAVANRTVAAGLPLVAALRRRLRPDRLSVRDPRGLRVALDAELVLQVMHGALDRRLADGREDRLVRRVVAAYVEGRILLDQLVHSV